jgi:hypothetical protein
MKIKQKQIRRIIKKTIKEVNKNYGKEKRFLENNAQLSEFFTEIKEIDDKFHIVCCFEKITNYKRTFLYPYKTVMVDKEGSLNKLKEALVRILLEFISKP